MRTIVTFALLASIHLASAAPVSAQRVTFERTFDVSSQATIDVTTIRGKINVVAGEPGRIVVTGTATVRVGWDVPSNAEELARQVAAAPPIQRDGDIVRLGPPAEGAARRAVTVSYQVRVPADTRLTSTSESGATTVSGLTGNVTVRTQSGAIDLSSLGAVDVSSGSGAIDVVGVTGPLAAKTSSSTIRLRRVAGAATITTQSGRVDLEGMPGPWTITTGSSSVHLAIAGSGFTIDAESRSGSIDVAGAPVDGAVAKRKVAGTIGGGGQLVKVTTRSGAIRLKVPSE
jgi:hypothetical protein